MFKLADPNPSIWFSFGVSNGDVRVHPSRLKDQILAQTLEHEAHKQGRDILLALKEDVGLASSCKKKATIKKALILKKAI